MTGAEKAALWDELGVKCDACQREIREDTRAYIIPPLAKAGFCHALCSVCAEGMTLAEVGRFTARVANRAHA